MLKGKEARTAEDGREIAAKSPVPRPDDYLLWRLLLLLSPLLFLSGPWGALPAENPFV